MANPYAPERIFEHTRQRIREIDGFIREREADIVHLEKLLASHRRAIVAWRNERAEAARFLREHGRA